MSDRITLRGMRFLGRHGVELEERLEPQPFEVDVIVRADLSRPAASDDLVDTIDYSGMFTRCRASWKANRSGSSRPGGRHRQRAAGRRADHRRGGG